MEHQQQAEAAHGECQVPGRTPAHGGHVQGLRHRQALPGLHAAGGPGGGDLPRHRHPRHGRHPQPLEPLQVVFFRFREKI